VQQLWYDDGQPLLFYTGGFRCLELQGIDDPWGF
jgi:hypothetical protein